MPYVGRDLSRGNYLKLDDLVSQFNGSKTTFNLTSGGSAFFPGSAFSILVSLGGIVQEPESAYTINKSQITFASAPLATDEFFIVALGVALGVGVPGHATVGGSKLTKPLEYDDYFYLDSTNNRVGIHSSVPTVALDVIGDIKLNGSLVTGGGGGLNGGIVTCTGLDVNGNGDISGTLTVGGNVSIGGTLTYLDVSNIDSVGIITAQQGIHLGAASTVGHLSTVGVSSIASLQVRDIDGDKIIRAGTNGRLTGDANLTYNGTNMLINGTMLNAVQLKFGNSGTAYIDHNIVGQDLQFRVGNSSALDKTALHIDSSGKVGINETTPEEILDLGESNKQNLKFGQRGYLGQAHSTTATILGHCVKADTTNSVASQMMVTETNSGGGAPSAIRQVSGTIQFHTASSGTADAVFDSERLRITKTGELLIGGHGSAIQPDNYASHLEVHGTATDAGISILRYSNNSGGPTLLLGKSRGATIGSFTKVVEDDSLGKIEFYGTDTGWESSASIRASADGEWYSGSVGSEDNTDAPGRLEFHTTPNGSDNLVEALRIGQNGFTTLNSGNGRTHACLVLSKADAGYAKLEFDVGTSQKAYVELDASEDLIHYGASGVTQRFYAGGSPRLDINASTGRVLIGDFATYAASGDLHIVGDTNSNGPELYLQVNNNNTTDNIGALWFGNNVDKSLVKLAGHTHSANNTADFTVSTSASGTVGERLRIHADGTITQNYGNPTSSTTFVISKDGSGAGELRFDTATNNTASLYLGSDEQLRIRYGGTEHTRFASNGNAGIGTITPGEKLDVNGAIRLRASNWTTYAAKLYAALDSTHCVRLDAYHNSSTAFEVIGTHADSGGANVRVVIAKGGQKVGINNTNPSYQLEVTGSFAATTKSFVIDHPTKENHKLIYACLEGPENSVYIRGRSSDPVIELPDYWVGLVHDDSITVNVTPIGNKNVWVESINNNSVTIGSDDSTEYFYTVFAERKDVEKLEVEVEK